MQAFKSALKAILVNKVGDMGFLGGSLILLQLTGSINFSDLNGSFLESGPCSLCLLLFMLALGGKSAQLGLHTWLPDAMEGPTPVSALIHAATMVTAGVFLMVRLSELFSRSYSVLLVLMVLGGSTTLFAGSVGIVHNDFKKVIAYSTCSQLGYMVIVLGAGEFSIGLFHLINHACFKALLFLSAGNIIHMLIDEQDFRKGINMA